MDLAASGRRNGRGAELLEPPQGDVGCDVGDSPTSHNKDLLIEPTPLARETTGMSFATPAAGHQVEASRFPAGRPRRLIEAPSCRGSLACI
jgi:hypothetical protein